MDSFWIYAQLGFEHISDLAGYDHILFVVVLCAVYRISQWRKILILVTAFTIGHSITLVLSSLKIISLQQEITEFFIPVTIFLTAIYNIWKGETKSGNSNTVTFHYLLALFVGFIHGMGFSNFFSSLFGSVEDILLPLFAFNVGLEIGQLLIVGVIMLASYLALNLAKVKFQYWNWMVSGIASIISLKMIWERVFW
ncbi:MAG: hypothetical protein ACJAWV_003862 [Flammeovirgaceae bacterium]|jgi:hypothetical protein